MRMTVEIIPTKITAWVQMIVLVMSFAAIMERASQLRGSVMEWMIVLTEKTNPRHAIMMIMMGAVGEFQEASPQVQKF